MTTRPESASPRSSAGPSPRLSSLGESLALVGERFSGFGALGLVAVDAQPLAEIERDYGYEAYLRALGSLASLVENLAKDRLSGDELLVTGETGHHELVVLLFRSSPGLGGLRAGSRRSGSRGGKAINSQRPEGTVLAAC